MRCPGSAVLCEQQPGKDKSSAFADEGTAAHELASWALEGDGNCSAFIGRLSHDAGRPIQITADMAHDTQVYVDAVLAYARDNVLFVEQELSLEHITGEPEAMGTSDSVIINAAAKELQVHDLKFGRGVLVNASDAKRDDNGNLYEGPNEQMAGYALCAYEQFKDFCELETVLMVIHQPRLGHTSEFRMTVSELVAFGETMSIRAKVAWAYLTELRHDPRAASKLDAADALVPGDKQCKFCRAKAACPAIRNMALNAIADDFIDLETAPVAVKVVEAAIERVEMSDDDTLDRLYPLLGLIEDWGRAVLGQIEKRMHEGASFMNCKLVQGKKGNRAWIDKTEVETVMKSMRLKADEMYDFSLISPSSADKLLAKANPKRWAKLKPLITQSDGRPSVAPITDKREALVTKAPSDDFVDERDCMDLVG